MMTEGKKEKEEQEKQKGNKEIRAIVEGSQGVTNIQLIIEHMHLHLDLNYFQRTLFPLIFLQPESFRLFEHGRILKITQQEINHPDYPHYAYEVTRDVHGNILEKREIPLSEQAKNPKFRVRINPREVEEQMIESLEAPIPPEAMIEQQGLPTGAKIAWVLKPIETFVLSLKADHKKVFPYLEMDMYVLPFSKRILLDNRNQQETEFHICIVLDTKDSRKCEILVSTKEAYREKVTSTKKLLESFVTVYESNEVNLWDLKKDERFLRIIGYKKPKEDIERTKRHLKYLEKLEKIEKHFGITFKLPNEIKKDDIETVELLHMFVMNEFKLLTFTAVFPAEEMEKFKEDGPTKLKATLPPNPIELYGVRIPLPKIEMVCHRTEIAKKEMVDDRNIRVVFKLDPNYTKVKLLNNEAD